MPTPTGELFNVTLDRETAFRYLAHWREMRDSRNQERVLILGEGSVPRPPPTDSESVGYLLDCNDFLEAICSDSDAKEIIKRAQRRLVGETGRRRQAGKRAKAKLKRIIAQMQNDEWKRRLANDQRNAKR